MENKIYYYDVYLETGAYLELKYKKFSSTDTPLNVYLWELRSWNNDYHLGVF